MSIANVTEVLLPKLEASLLYKLSATCRELQTECGKDFLWENLLVRDLLQTHCAEKSCVANASSTTEPSARTKYVKILKPQADTLVCRLCENR